MKLWQMDHSQTHQDWAPSQQQTGRMVSACEGHGNLPSTPWSNTDAPSANSRCSSPSGLLWPVYDAPFTRQTTTLGSAYFLLLFPTSFFTCILFYFSHPYNFIFNFSFISPFTLPHTYPFQANTISPLTGSVVSSVHVLIHFYFIFGFILV
jgi:hypothetical protein